MRLSGSNILIVGEAPGTLELRERLIASLANVQVVSIAGPPIVIRQKQIDSAFIAASLDQDTRQLCGELSALGRSSLRQSVLASASGHRYGRQPKRKD